jgi:uncharacterized membrane protein
MASAARGRPEGRVSRRPGGGMLIVVLLLASGLTLWLLDVERRTADRLLHAGLLTLMLLPVRGIIVSIVTFARERDWVFASVALCVLAVVAVSFWVALRQ